MTRASGLPVLVDGDTGYGEALNVMHMVRAFEDAGAGAIHIEDQRLPKKCGHLNDKTLVDAREMAAKVAAAAKARRHLYLIARTDAAESEGLDGAVARARLYVEAGADAIFPEALTSSEMFRAFANRLQGVPLLANMTEFGRTPMMTKDQFQVTGLSHGPLAGIVAACRQQSPGSPLRNSAPRWLRPGPSPRYADPKGAVRSYRSRRLRSSRQIDRSYRASPPAL